MYLAFELLGMHRLGAYSNPANERSTRALVGVGLQPEGTLRDWHRHGERWHDVTVFGLLREDWAAGALAAVQVRAAGEVPAGFATVSS